MLRALQTASSGMIAQQNNIDNIANNLANVNTTAFKKSRTDFQDLLYVFLGRQGGVENAGVSLQVGLGTRLAGTPVDFSQGNWQPTGNPLDLAIRGNAFFKVEMNGNTYYTRDGTFRLDAEGTLLYGDGYTVVGAEEITNATNIEISQTGEITYLDENGDIVEAGRIELAIFSNPAGLERIGGNLYRETQASGEAQDWDGEGDISIQQGFLESSNVQVVQEMVNMITAQRAYETNAKVIQASDEMLGLANSLRR